MGELFSGFFPFSIFGVEDFLENFAGKWERMLGFYFPCVFDWILRFKSFNGKFRRILISILVGYLMLATFGKVVKGARKLKSEFGMKILYGRCLSEEIKKKSETNDSLWAANHFSISNISERI